MIHRLESGRKSMLIQSKTIWTPDNSYLLEYRERIETGEILVGQELWMELENLKDDFSNHAQIISNPRIRKEFLSALDLYLK